MKGDDLIAHMECTDHMVRDRAVFSSSESWNEGISVENPNDTPLRIEGKGSVEIVIIDCQVTARS